MNAPTIIVGLIFIAILFFAARKSIRNFRAGKCESCSCGCKEENKKITQPDKSKTLL